MPVVVALTGHLSNILDDRLRTNWNLEKHARNQLNSMFQFKERRGQQLLLLWFGAALHLWSNHKSKCTLEARIPISATTATTYTFYIGPVILRFIGQVSSKIAENLSVRHQSKNLHLRPTNFAAYLLISKNHCEKGL